MKDLLIKEYYWYKIQTALTKSSAYSPFYIQPPVWINTSHAPYFSQENLDLPFYNF